MRRRQLFEFEDLGWFPALIRDYMTDYLRFASESFDIFAPEVARRMLANAVEAGQPIAVFEAQRRDVEHLLRFALSPVMVLLLTPLIRPVELGRILLTYLPPVIPLFVLWDGLVSVLRTYSSNEMLALARAADESSAFEWESGDLLEGPAKIPYLIGWPAAKR